MSASAGPALTAAQLNPQPERWGAFRAGNVDSRARDTSGDLAPLNDTVNTVTVTVARCDGAALGPQDLAWTGSSSLDATLRVVTIMLQSGKTPPKLTPQNPVQYIVTMTVTTNGGRTLSWDAYQLVVAQIG